MKYGTFFMDLTSLTSQQKNIAMWQSEITQQLSEWIIRVHQRHLERTPLMQGVTTDQTLDSFYSFLAKLIALPKTT